MKGWASVVLSNVLSMLVAADALAVGPKIEQTMLPNGAGLFVSTQKNLPLIIISVILDAGSRRDPVDAPGLAHLTADALTHGTYKRSATELNEEIDFIGASLSTRTNGDWSEVQLKVLRKDLHTGLDLLADVLLNPAFTESELARRREAIVASLRDVEDDASRLASRKFRELVYEGEPYGHVIEGTLESVPKLSRERVVQFYRVHYRPAGAKIVVVGDISLDEAVARLGSVLTTWEGAAPPPLEYSVGGLGAPRTVRIGKPVTQAAIVLGHRGVPRNHPDFEALTVMNYVLGGGGFSSRLMDRVRVQSGLVYHVSSQFGTGRYTGSFQIVMQTKNESVQDAIELATEEVHRLLNEPISDAELQEAKQYLTGSFALRLDSNAEIADYIGEILAYDLGLDYADRYLQAIKHVTREDVQRVARQFLHPENFIQVIVGRP